MKWVVVVTLIDGEKISQDGVEFYGYDRQFSDMFFVEVPGLGVNAWRVDSIYEISIKRDI